MTLRDLNAAQPLEQGLAELITYLQLGNHGFTSSVDEETVEDIEWIGQDTSGESVRRVARMPRVIYTR